MSYVAVTVGVKVEIALDPEIKPVLVPPVVHVNVGFIATPVEPFALAGGSGG